MHYSDVTMNGMVSQIACVSIVCSTVSSGAYQKKKTSNLRVTGPCKGNPPVTGGSPHKGPVTREMFPFDDVIMWCWKISLDGVFWKTSYSHQATVDGVRLEKGIDINGALLKDK